MLKERLKPDKNQDKKEHKQTLKGDKNKIEKNKMTKNGRQNGSKKIVTNK